LRPLKNGRKTSLFKVQHAEIVALHKRRPFIGERVKYSKTAVHTAVVKFVKGNMTLF